LTYIIISIPKYLPKVICSRTPETKKTILNQCVALQNAGGDPSGWNVPAWTLEADQRLNIDIGVKTAILSITAPGACIEEDPKKAAALARATNEEGAAIRDTNPSGYGFFANLPDLLDTELALKEMAYALDELHADGVILFTRYGKDNHYLGHADFKPIWAELNRRKAVVFIHPTHGVDTNLVNNHLPQPMFDYPQETGRTAIDMILSNTMPLVKDCKIILSHGGGTLPLLVERVAGLMPFSQFSVGKSSEELIRDAQKFYFDTALTGTPRVLDLLRAFARPGHILFGSDFPNAPVATIEYFSTALERSVGPEALQELGEDSALKLFPRLRS
jgi:predicted TIM-barrel fold metal-dependent hydrolase